MNPVSNDNLFFAMFHHLLDVNSFNINNNIFNDDDIDSSLKKVENYFQLLTYLSKQSNGGKILSYL